MNIWLPIDNEDWSARKARRTHGQHSETKVGQVHRSGGTGNGYLRATAPAFGHSARANNCSYCDNRKRLCDDPGSVQNLACRGRKALYCKDVANLACIPGPSRRRFDRDRRAPHFLTHVFGAHPGLSVALAHLVFCCREVVIASRRAPAAIARLTPFAESELTRECWLVIWTRTD